MHLLLDFLEWYYLRAPKAQLIFAKNVVLFIEDSFGIITNLVYFFKPWYGDTSLVGRILSLFIRFIMILTGSIAVAITVLTFFLLPVIWVGISFIIPWYPEAVIAPILGIGYFLVIGKNKPKVIYPHISKPHHLHEAMVGSSKNLFYLYPSPLFFKELATSSKILRFVIKTQLPFNEIITVLQSRSTQITRNQLQTRLHELCLTHHLRHIRAPHILAALMYETVDTLQPILETHRASIKELKNYLEWDEYEYTRARPPLPFEEDYYNFTGGGTNRAHLGVVTPFLNEVSTDITKEASYTHRELRTTRTDVINQIEHILQKHESANVILRGEKGTGKESIILQIAQMILLGQFNNALWSKRIIRIDLVAFLAKGQQEGFELYLEKIRHEIRRSKNIIIYLDDLQTAIDTAQGQKTNILALIEESLSTHVTSTIIACTPEEYTLLKNSYPRLIQLSETIDVNQTTNEETIQITHLHALLLESQYDVIIPYPTIKLTVQFSQDYIHNVPFPQKAINLLEDTIIESSRSNEPRSRTPWGARLIIHERHVTRTLTEKTHIPVGTITHQEANILLNLATEMRKHIASQDKAIEAIVTTLQRNRAGVRTQTRPIGSFLFAGPTGVGKTHVAKTLAQLYFGATESMIRLDMSEYQSPDSMHRLVSRETGSLVEHVRSMPFSLVLLDEVEKAHPQILDLFLQILDDARLTDEHGTTCDFTQTIIIGTTNAGNTELNVLENDTLYFQKATEILKKYFRTEFLNRFDNIIAFEPLSTESIQQVLDIKLKTLAQKLYEEKKIQIEISAKTREWLTTFGYSKELGARNLNRLIQETIETKLAQKILSGEIKEGHYVKL